jgi:hypothetical protein
MFTKGIQGVVKARHMETVAEDDDLAIRCILDEPSPRITS